MSEPKSSPSAEKTQADVFFETRIKARVIEAQQRLRSEIEGMPETRSGREVLESFADDPKSVELFGARLAFKQLSASFEAMFSADFQIGALQRAGARETQVIETRMSPSARLREHTRAFPSVAPRFFTEDRIAALRPSVSVMRTYTFDDGSIACVIQPDPDTLRVNSALLNQAQGYSDVAGNSKSSVSDLADSFEQLGASVLTKMSSQFRYLPENELRALFEQVCFDSIKTLMTLPQGNYPARDANALAGNLAQKHGHDSGWKEGIGVFVDQAPAESPEALVRALGSEPLFDLDAALGAIRDRALAKHASKAEEAKKTAKPRRPKAP